MRGRERMLHQLLHAGLLPVWPVVSPMGRTDAGRQSGAGSCLIVGQKSELSSTEIVFLLWISGHVMNNYYNSTVILGGIIMLVVIKNYPARDRIFNMGLQLF